MSKSIKKLIEKKIKLNKKTLKKIEEVRNMFLNQKFRNKKKIIFKREELKHLISCIEALIKSPKYKTFNSTFITMLDVVECDLKKEIHRIEKFLKDKKIMFGVFDFFDNQNIPDMGVH